MQSAVVFDAVIHGGAQRLVFKKVAVLHRLGNAGQLLIDDAAGTDVGVTDLAVAHLPVGQTHRHARCAESRHGAGGEEGVQMRGAGVGDGVIFSRIGNSKAVQDHQH